MAKIRIKAHKLEEANVSHISLVSRGANRIPFRILKRENQKMIDLARLFKADKSTKSMICGLVVEKFGDIEAVRKAVKEAGFNDENHSDVDDTFVFSQVDNLKPYECGIIKAEDNVLVLVDKSDEEILKAASVGFEDVIEKLGCFPSIEVISGKVQKQISEAIASGDDIAQKSEIAIKSLQAYTDAVNGIIPEGVKKLSESIRALKEDDEDDMPPNKPEDSPEDKPDTDNPEDNPEDKPEGKPEDDKPEDKSDVDKKPEEKEDEEPDNSGDDLKAAIAGLSNQVSALMRLVGEMASVKSDISTMQKSITEAVEKIDSVEKIAKTAQDAVSATVVGGMPPSDKTKKREVSKDTDPRTGIFDTAFLPRK